MKRGEYIHRLRLLLVPWYTAKSSVIFLKDEFDEFCEAFIIEPDLMSSEMPKGDKGRKSICNPTKKSELGCSRQHLVSLLLFLPACCPQQSAERNKLQ